MTRSLIRGLQTAAAFIVMLPLLALLHETLTFFFAALLDKTTKTGLLTGWLRLVVRSPVHTQLMTETIGGVRPEGIAAPGPMGSLLQQAFPGLFVRPDYAASGAWVSAVLNKNSTVLSLFLTRALVEIAFVVAGALLIRAGLRHRSIRAFAQASMRDFVFVALGLFVEAQAIWTLFLLTLSSPTDHLNDMGIGFALSLLWRVEPESYRWLMERFFPIAIPIVLVGLGFGIAWLFGRVLDGVQARRAGHRQSPEVVANQWRLRHYAALLIAVLPLVGLASQSQYYFGLAKTSLIIKPEVKSRSIPIAATPALEMPTNAVPADDPISIESNVPLSSLMTSPTPEPTATLAPAVAPTAPSSPDTSLSPTPTSTSTLAPPTMQKPTPSSRWPDGIRVRIRRTELGHLLIVNGHPTVLTGMNYNVNYTQLPAETKRALHRRDFQIMKQAGVNAIIGWGVYDEVTLEIAHEFGIGVIMPFELDPQGAYENQNYRNEIKDNWRLYIKRFQQFPAVWAWNPGGDELLHRMDTEQHRTVDKLQAAADFLVELSVLAYSLDPNHVSVIKEPRDWYVPHLDEAVRKQRATSPSVDPETFLVYAVNIYGNPNEIVDALGMARRNTEDRLGIALLVGEYAPFGLPRKDRGVHYARIWDDVHAFSPNGGFAYVFGPDQPNLQAPNPYDPLRLLVNEFSLVDGDGAPVDDALSLIAARYHQVRNPLFAP